MIHAEGDLAVNILLSILRSLPVDQAAESTQVAARSRGHDPVIQRHDIRRVGTAAGDAGAADLVGDDVVARLQVVDGSGGVPDHQTGGVAAEQEGTLVEQLVFLRGGR